MTIIEVSPKAYKEVFPSPYHLFNSVDFNELNRDKCESIHYLLFEDAKIRLGLIIGIKEMTACSPFSAPFGGFSFHHEFLSAEVIDNALQSLDEYLTNRYFRAVKFILPPLCYHQSFLTKLVNSFVRHNYTISHIDLNHSFDTSLLNEHYSEQTLRNNARKNLNIALKQHYLFQKTDDIDLVYDIIRQNRAMRGFPLRMTLEQVKSTVQIIHWDAFVVRSADDFVASALIYHITNRIVQIIYWGNIPVDPSLKVMNYLAYQVFNYYKAKDIDIIDIGPSSEHGLPNFGLCDFKESIGCTVTPKFTFEKQLV